MDPWIAKGIVLASSIVMIVIRAPHGQRSRGVPVTRSARGRTEGVVLTLAWIGFVVAVVWIVSDLFSFAEFEPSLVALVCGVFALVAGLWIFSLSHADLGTNWSITLEIRAEHRLITSGVYRHVRHPMYSALLLCSIGQALVIPNWIAGPSYLAAFGLLLAFRLRAEERMMTEEFGDEYREYAQTTWRLVPRIW